MLKLSSPRAIFIADNQIPCRFLLLKQLHMVYPGWSLPEHLMRFLPTVAALCLLATACAQSLAQSRFKVEADNRGVWSFITPSGQRVFSLGVCNVNPKAWNPRPDTHYYNSAEDQFRGDTAAWAKATLSLLKENGFNTLGCWSGPDIPTVPGIYRTPILYVAGYGNDRCLAGLRPGFADLVRANTRERFGVFHDVDSTLGVFLDNEMPWWGKNGWEKIPNFTLLDVALALPSEDPARAAALEFIKSRYKTPGLLGAAWGQPLTEWAGFDADYAKSLVNDSTQKDRSDFTTLAADRWYETAAKVVREELPGLLILGTRFAGDAPDGAIIACGRVSDVVAVNDYSGEPHANMPLLSRYWLLTKKPLMLTEFAWRATENASGNPNTRGAGPVVATQADRAERYRALVSDLMTVPVVVGAHWFEFADQSPEGRFDGEDSNYGIVDLQNRPYTALLNAMRETHARVRDLRDGSVRRMPESMPPMKEMPLKLPEQIKVTYAPAQRPDSPPNLEVIDSPGRDPELWNAPDAHASWSRDNTAIALKYDVGVQYGVGINLFGPAAAARSIANRTIYNLDGYTRIVVDLEAPKGLQINATVYEAASAAPGLAKYDAAAGDDGEAFISRPIIFQGGRSTLTIEISTLEIQPYWGNQSGGKRIDMSAIKNVGLQLQGRPTSGTVKVFSYRLER